VPGQPAALVEHSGSGWHCAATASALAFAARLVANTPREDRLRRGEAGRQFVRGHCASEGQARGIAQLCDDVVSGARSSRSRIAGAGIRALGDLASGRARRLVRALYDDPRGLASRAAFEAWLARSVTQSVWAPIAIPSILE